MEIKIPVQNIDLRNAQERLDDNLRQIRNTSRKATLAYAGLWAMAYDEAAAILERGRKLLSEAESRGEDIECEATERVHAVRNQAQDQLKKVENRLDKLRGQAKKEARKAESKVESKLDNELESQVERVLDRLGIPSRERIIRLSNELEALSLKIDARFGAQGVPAASAAEESLPIANYAELNVREVNAALEGLSMDELALIKAYELTHENRVTVLRELERRMEPVAA
jgi:TolA-binding protein